MQHPDLEIHLQLLHGHELRAEAQHYQLARQAQTGHVGLLGRLRQALAPHSAPPQQAQQPALIQSKSCCAN